MANNNDAMFDTDSGLTLQQRLFCDHYLTHLNARLA